MSDLWSSVLNDIRSQVRSEAYNTWFRPLDCDEVEDDRVVVSVPDDFYLSWFQDNYVGLLTDTLSQHLGLIPQVEFLQREDERNAVRAHVDSIDSGLNPKYRFESFVVGDSNKFPNAASIGVAQNPGESYNPLFIYGKVGLGKTHLLHAIGNAVLENNHNARVKYVTCETFVNDVVKMLATGRDSDGFRSMYRDSVDVLLVDDIQFLGGKEKSQVEFFNVFNALYGMRRQIVMSCDRYPRDIPQLEQRLQSRFQWGLVVDIEQPDLETRMAILSRKAEERGLELPQDVSMLIATNIKSNVRELEGSLTRIIAFIELTQSELTPETARLALGNLLVDGNSRLTVDRVIQTTANYFNISVKEMKGAGRKRSISTPRHVAMYLAKQLTESSYPTLGERFGGRDHTTVLSAVQKIDRLMGTGSDDICQDVERLREILED